MKLSVIALLFATFYGCGKSDDGEKKAGTTPVAAAPRETMQTPGTTTPPPPAPAPQPSTGTPDGTPTSIEGDFFGILTLDAAGLCTVQGGNNIPGVGCQLILDQMTRQPQLVLTFGPLGLRNAPVCTFQSIGATTPRLTVANFSATSVALSVEAPTGRMTPATHGGFCPPPEPGCPPCPFPPQPVPGPTPPLSGPVAAFQCKVTG